MTLGKMTLGSDLDHCGVNMSAQILVLGFGSLLILLGLVGGGFTIKSVDLPKIRNVARTFSVIIGLVLVIFGMFGFDDVSEIDADPTVDSSTDG